MGIESFSRSDRGPTPERRRMAGELNAPAERITSLLARNVSPPAVKTPIAILLSLKRILSTAVSTRMVKFGGGDER